MEMNSGLIALHLSSTEFQTHRFLRKELSSGKEHQAL